jgi:hypothetical protein
VSFPDRTWTVLIAEADGSTGKDYLSRPASQSAPVVKEIITTAGNRQIVVDEIETKEGRLGTIRGRPHTR